MSGAGSVEQAWKAAEVDEGWATDQWPSVLDSGAGAPQFPESSSHAAPNRFGQEAVVDLRPLKRAARALPETDPARRLIEGEPDSLPFQVLAAKADSWILLLLPRED